ncbi:UNVERIFIED_CONTAM: Vesicle-associated membrane protein 1 [Trichonephila clavipes]
MRTNVEKVLERDQKLSELDDRAEALQQGASQFEQQAGKLKRKFWWKNCKMIIIMVVIGVVVVGVIGGKQSLSIHVMPTNILFSCCLSWFHLYKICKITYNGTLN